MKRSSQIIILGILALTAAACDEPAQEVKHCVNADGVVVDEKLCNPGDDGGIISSSPVTDDAGNPIYIPHEHPVNGGPPVIFYRWYYGGYSRPVSPGTRIITNGAGPGRYVPAPGHVYSTPSFSKGGFGSTGHGFSGGGE